MKLHSTSCRGSTVVETCGENGEGVGLGVRGTKGELGGCLGIESRGTQARMSTLMQVAAFGRLWLCILIFMHFHARISKELDKHWLVWV